MLQGRANPILILLQWLESHEYGDWYACDAVARANLLDRKELAQYYDEAVVWAEADDDSAF